MAITNDTTIIFVPGAWHGPEGFTKVAHKLKEAGYATDFVELASVGPKEHLKDMQPDVAVIRKHVQTALDQGRKVVMVMHSYGSLPSQEAVVGLDYRSRQAQGKSGGVTHLFFMCALIVPQGETLISAFGGSPLPWFIVSDDQLQVDPATPEHMFYNDLPDDLIKSCVAELKPFSYQAMNSPVNAASWKVISSTYLYTLQDNALPMSVQKMMVEETAAGAGIRTEVIDASHSPFHSKPDETAAAIQRAAELPL